MAFLTNSMLMRKPGGGGGGGTTTFTVTVANPSEGLYGYANMPDDEVLFGSVSPNNGTMVAAAYWPDGVGGLTVPIVSFIASVPGVVVFNGQSYDVDHPTGSYFEYGVDFGLGKGGPYPTSGTFTIDFTPT